MGSTEFVGRYKIARSEGLLLRYFSDARPTPRQTVPAAHRPPELEDLVERLGETVQQTDSLLPTSGRRCRTPTTYRERYPLACVWCVDRIYAEQEVVAITVDGPRVLETTAPRLPTSKHTSACLFESLPTRRTERDRP